MAGGSPRRRGFHHHLFAINTEDTPLTCPTGNPDFDNLNQINTALTGPQPTKRKEQSLAIDYAFNTTTGPATVTAKSVTVAPMDFNGLSATKWTRIL